jgi:hypothetical protein
MLPKTGDGLKNDLEIVQLPSRTFRLTTDGDRIAGMTDGIEAVEQAVYLMLNVPRYQYLVYSWDYGVELSDLIGMPAEYCLSEIKTRITQALLMDDRIQSVTDFVPQADKGKIHVSFNVNTSYGTINEEMEVSI